MPELPEVETIVRGLSSILKGLEIATVRLLCLRIYKDKDSSDVNKIVGKKIINIRRKGKMILLDCEEDLTLLIHLGMTGQLFCIPSDHPIDKHTHFILGFEAFPQELRFRDVRKFGFLSCLFEEQAFGFNRLKRLGAEPLEINYSDFISLFKGRRARLKSLLLDQTFIAGIGNIYADEILFHARLHPLRPAHLIEKAELRCLWRAIRKVLHQAIEHRGSSIRDYRDSKSQMGSYQEYHLVYGKEACPCSVCGQRIVRIRISGRSSFFCPVCQPFRTR
jgi:formamidopyrimidine-DNA glycosylase